MEIAGFIYIGNRYRCSRDSPTLLAIGELSSEQSTNILAQEPRITAFVSQDPKMIQSFKDNRDIYGSIASVAFNVPYEQCLEFNPETGEYQPEGKARRSEAKSIVLGRPNRFQGLAIKTNAPSVEAIVHRLLRVNFVNCITHRCIAHGSVSVGNDS